MPNDKRVFFRFDVTVPYYLEPVNCKGLCMHVKRESLISDQEYKVILHESAALDKLFKDERHIENGGTELFSELHQKMQFMVFLLESILHGEDIRNGDEFQKWIRINQQISLPEAKGSSKVLPLLQAFYRHVDDYITELLDVIEHSVQGKVFMYHKASPKPFDCETYIEGLPALAQKGNWLALVITLLVAKLNHYESLFLHLKQAYKNLSSSESWPVEQVNLGAGGFAVYTEQLFKQGQRVCALFQMDDDFVFGQARCVYQGDDGNKGSKHRTAFEFDKIGSEDSAHIVRFLMHKELEFREIKP